MFARGTGRPLTAQEVHLSVYAIQPWKFVAMATADDEGRFRFRDIPPGKYRVIANPRKAVYRKAEVDVGLGASGNREGLEIRLEECDSGTVRFVVRDQAGRPVEGVRFATVDVKANSSSSLLAESREPGVYVGDTEAGSRRIDVFCDGFQHESLTVKVRKDDTTEVRVVLRPKK